MATYSSFIVKKLLIKSVAYVTAESPIFIL